MKKMVIAWAALVLLVIGTQLRLYTLELPEKNPDFGIDPEGHYDWGATFNYLDGWRPAPSGKPFDVLVIDLNREEPAFFQIFPVDGGTLYLDRENSKLEKRALGFWFKAPARDGFDSALEHLEMSREDVSPRSGTYVYNINAIMHYADTDRGMHYRLTLVFTENKDGSGERYELRLRIEA